MSRPIRVEYPGAIYHVTVRGNARNDIFRDDGDRRLLYSRFEKSVELFQTRVYLFCLMDNHFHLVVETSKANLGRFMHSVLTGYTVCYNLRHRTHGHLTQGRYAARLVSGDIYLLKLSRYVHLNPVKTEAWTRKTVPERLAHLRGYKWSSYLGYVGEAPRQPWVHYAPMLALVGERDREKEYRQFVEAGVAEDDTEFLEAMRLSARSIGAEEFRAEVDERHAAVLRSRRRAEDVMFRRGTTVVVPPASVLAAVAKLAGVKVDDLKDQRRSWPWKGIAALLLVKHTGLTRRDVAPFVGLNGGSTVTYQITQAEQALSQDKDLRNRIARLEKPWRV